MGMQGVLDRLGLKFDGFGNASLDGTLKCRGIAGSLLTGRSFYVSPSGSDHHQGEDPAKPLATIEAAYDKCVSGRHDTVYYIPSTTSGINLTAALTWSKSYTHFVGLSAPTLVAQRARIFQLGTLTGASPLITVSGQGCIFQNLYIFQGVDDATSLINVKVTGGRNYFENVHFAGGGHATQAIDGGASLLLDGAEENTFVNCTFGVDTVAAGTGMSCVLFDTEAHRNQFINCNFTLYSGHAAANFVEVVDSTGIDRYNIFRNCLFINSNTTLTQAFAIPSGISGPRLFIMYDCELYGATDWDANDRGVLKLSRGTRTGGGNAGIMQASAAT